MCVCNQANLTDTLATLFITGRHRYDLYREAALSRVQANASFLFFFLSSLYNLPVYFRFPLKKYASTPSWLRCVYGGPEKRSNYRVYRGNEKNENNKADKIRP